jgi:uncharacterized protein with von Willebrand factor type A (vWA) domain
LTASSPADLVEQLVRFGDALRRERVPVGTDRVGAFCEAVASARVDLYWAGRLTLVGRHDDLAVYDRVFSTHFGGRRLLTQRPDEPPAAAEQSADFGAPGQPSEREPTGQLSLASTIEVLREKSFSAYTEAELQLLLAACRRIAVPPRRSRRHRAARSGQPDLRRTLRASLRMGGEPARRVWRVRGKRPRRVVLLLDVSGSMTSYSRALLHFAYASVHAQRHWEVFCFATRLSRLTHLFRTGTADEALERATAEVRDFDGGTRIGSCIGEFLREYGHRGMARGAVVIICSDGMEIDEPEALRQQMQRLALLAHRVVWLNPLKEDPAYEPLARGMRAALPSIDVFASGHNLASLEALADGLVEVVAGRRAESR